MTREINQIDGRVFGRCKFPAAHLENLICYFHFSAAFESVSRPERRPGGPPADSPWRHAVAGALPSGLVARRDAGSVASGRIYFLQPSILEHVVLF